MSATFNYELFANYFSKSSITNIEHLEVYVGAQAQYDKEEEEKKRREETGWGPASSTDWTSKQEEDEDQWVVTRPIVSMPVRKAEDPADVVVINARCFKVTEFYIDDMIDNILKESEKKRIVLTPQDRELLVEAQQTSSAYLKANVKEAAMRVATIIICDVIERLNSFEEASEVKASILIFLPGLAEILQFIEYIGEFYDKLWIKQNLELIPLHSSLNEEE
jgi:HrpA-like RNA helicase